MKKILTLLAIAAMVAVACDKDNNDSTYKAPISIDGDFADWAALDASKVVVAKNAVGSPWEAVKEIRVYADKKFVYYYMKFDGEVLADIQENSTNKSLPLRLNFNTDGEFKSGYHNYFIEGYDIMTEGNLTDNEGNYVSYDGELYFRTEDSWGDPILGPGNNLTSGAGKDYEYEIALSREVFDSAISSTPLGNTFQTSVRFYYINDADEWDELSNMPNLSIDESENGWGHLLEITTNK